MGNQRPYARHKRPSSRWTQRDLLVIGNLGLLSGLLLIAASTGGTLALISTRSFWLAIPINVATGHLLLVPTLLAATLIRKPGAALAVQAPIILVIGLLTASAYDALRTCFLYGSVSELAIAAITRYRRFGWPRIALCGLPAALLSLAFAFARHPLPATPIALLPALWLGVGAVALGYGALAGWSAARLRGLLALEPDNETYTNERMNRED